MSRDLTSLGERIAEHAAHLDAAMHRLLSDLREFDQGGGWHVQGARSCAHWLSWRVGWDLGTARERVRVANKLAGLPRIDQALQRGELSYSKVRAMTRVATVENEDTILELARVSPAHQLETICRKYAIVQRHDSGVRPDDDAQRRYVSRRDTADGMVRIEVVLHPDEAAIVWAALDQIAKAHCRESPHVSNGTASASAAAVALETSEPDDHQAPSHVPAETPPAEHDQEPQRISARTHSPHTAAIDLEVRELDDHQDPSCVSAETYSAHTAAVDLDAREPGQGHAPSRVSAETHSGHIAALDVQPRHPRHQRHACHAEHRRFDRADALVALAQAHVRGDRPDRSPIELVLTVETRTLARAGGPTDPGPTDPTNHTDPTAVACFRDGTCISPEAARRLSCDAGVVEVIQDDHGNPLSVGRKTRTIPGPMKRALLKRDQTCRFPGCTNRIFLEGHHIRHWADGGETKLDNILSICTHHHHFVHEHGYLIDLDDDGPHFRDPLGRPVLDVPPPPPIERRGWDVILDRNADLEITAQTNECAWDGGRVDHAVAIDHLVRADQLA